VRKVPGVWDPPCSRETGTFIYCWFADEVPPETVPPGPSGALR